MFDLNIDEIEDVTGGLAPGEHLLTVAKAELKETKAQTGLYIKVEFNSDAGKHWENYNIKNPNDKAEKIGKSQLKAFLKAAGYAGTNLNDVNSLLGLKVLATIRVTKDNGFGEGRAISKYRAVEASDAPGADPFV